MATLRDQHNALSSLIQIIDVHLNAGLNKDIEFELHYMAARVQGAIGMIEWFIDTSLPDRALVYADLIEEIVSGLEDV